MGDILEEQQRNYRQLAEDLQGLRALGAALERFQYLGTVLQIQTGEPEVQSR